MLRGRRTLQPPIRPRMDKADRITLIVQLVSPHCEWHDAVQLMAAVGAISGAFAFDDLLRNSMNEYTKVISPIAKEQQAVDKDFSQNFVHRTIKLAKAQNDDAPKVYILHRTLCMMLENQIDMHRYAKRAASPEPSNETSYYDEWLYASSNRHGRAQNEWDFWKGGGREGIAPTKAHADWKELVRETEQGWNAVLDALKKQLECVFQIWKNGIERGSVALRTRIVPSLPPTQRLIENQRRTLLIDALKARHLSLRSDSELCIRFIETGQPPMNQVVDTMESMAFLYKRTEYASYIKNALSQSHLPRDLRFEWSEKERDKLRDGAKVEATRHYVSLHGHEGVPKELLDLMEQDEAKKNLNLNLSSC